MHTACHNVYGAKYAKCTGEKIRCHRFSWNFAEMLYEYQTTKVQKDFSLSSFVVKIQGRQFCHLMKWVFFQKLIAYTTLLKKIPM